MLPALLMPLALLAQAEPTPGDRILGRHLEGLGGAEALVAAGDLVLEGTLEGAPYRVLVRRSPFGVREELRQRGAEPRVFVSDGEFAWDISPGGQSRPVDARAAASVLDFAFLWGLAYLEPGRAEAWLDTPVVLPALRELGAQGQVTCRAVRMTSFSGTCWSFLFGADDGRLHGLQELGARPARWARFGAWKIWEGLTLPSVRVDGQEGLPITQRITLTRVTTGHAHDPALFLGSPDERVPPWCDATPLDVLPGPVPASAVFVLPALRLRGGVTTPGLLDTGSAEFAVEPGLAARLGLTILAQEEVQSPMGPSLARIGWIDWLELGSVRLVQARAAVAAFPAVGQLGAADQPLVHLGGPRLMRLAPVLDLRSGRLVLRGAPAAALASRAEGVPAATVLEVPLAPLATGWPLATLEVRVDGCASAERALLDTGIGPVLRLEYPALERLGLPLDEAAWIDRGALPIEVAGLGGTPHRELVARIEELAVGAVVYRRPWVVLALHDSGVPGSAAILGAGALLPFARVGIDLAGGRLELEPGDGIARAGDGRWIVAAPGAFLGLGIEPGARGSGDAQLPLVNLIVRGSPAEKAGVAVGACLAAVDGEPSTSIPFAALCRRLWPPEGETIALTLRGPGAAKERTVRLP